jgi:hypothetical protein
LDAELLLLTDFAPLVPPDAWGKLTFVNSPRAPFWLVKDLVTVSAVDEAVRLGQLVLTTLSGCQKKVGRHRSCDVTIEFSEVSNRHCIVRLVSHKPQL